MYVLKIINCVRMTFKRGNWLPRVLAWMTFPNNQILDFVTLPPFVNDFLYNKNLCSRLFSFQTRAADFCDSETAGKPLFNTVLVAPNES